MKLVATTPINFLLFIKYFTFYLFRLKTGNYSCPPQNIIDIGKFDKNGNILIDDESNIKLFDGFNVSISYKKDSIPYKENKVRIKYSENNIMVCKMFSKTIRQKVGFYRELENINRIEDVNISPRIYFVDYQNYTIYMSLIEGCLLKNELTTISVLRRNQVRNELIKNLKKIHDYDLMLPDLKGGNIVITENELVFIDFEDAILLKYLPKQVKKYFKNRDNKKLQNITLKQIESSSN